MFVFKMIGLISASLIFFFSFHFCHISTKSKVSSKFVRLKPDNVLIQDQPIIQHLPLTHTHIFP